MSTSHQHYRAVLTIQLSKNLQELMEMKGVNRICIFKHTATEPHYQSQQWRFEDNVIVVGVEVYSLQKLINFAISDQILALYF